MQQDWITQPGNRKLIIFVMGWGSEPGLVTHIAPEGYDRLIVYDYRTIEPLQDNRLPGYDKIYLFAWSFGVWVAEQIASDIPLTKAVACGGTPLPVDDRYGMPRRPFVLTMRSIRSAGTDEFCRRTYGESYSKVITIPPSRSLDEMAAELEHLYEESAKTYRPHIKWDKAIIGSLDTIFPTENQVAYWGDTGTIVEEMPHYPFADPATVTDELD